MSPIKSYKHFKSYNHYNDLYDRFTVEECRRIEKSLSNLEYKPKLKDKKKSKKKELKVITNLAPIPLYFLKGERYLEKTETIRKWMARDGALDEKLENTPAPQNILCSSCSSEMEVTMKDLQTNLNGNIERVLFFFECPRCKKRKLVYENGELWKPNPVLCPKCKAEMDREKSKKRNNKITTIYTCPGCDYKEKDVWDLDEKPKPEKIDSNFEKDRRRFCLSSTEGQEYISQKERLNQVQNILLEGKEQEKNREFLVKIKKLNIADLSQFLIPKLKKENYVKLDFTKSEIVKGDVAIEFTIQDSKVGRDEYDSRIQLQRLLKKKLANTNWRLMSEGICYRLGILSGRLRGYEDIKDTLNSSKRKEVN